MGVIYAQKSFCYRDIQKYIPKVVEAVNNALLMEPKGLPLTHPTLARWNQVLLILKELHASGYAHRDIWPNNILGQIEINQQYILCPCLALDQFWFLHVGSQLVP